MAENLQKTDSSIWDSFIDNLQIVIDQVQNGEVREKANVEFNSAIYWKKLGDAFKAISHEATKLSISYSKLPVPSNVECDSLLQSAQKSVLNLVTVYSNLPKSSGVTLRKAVKPAVRELVESIKSLAESIKRFKTGSPEQFQNTGIVWEEAERFSKLPHDNKAAVTLLIDKNIPMVDDAHAELTEALNCDEDDDGLDDFLCINNNASQNDQHWTEADRTVIQYCLGLVKCSKSILKKTRSAVATNGSCDSEVMVSQLDDLADYVERLSPTVDELSTCVYPPLRHHVVCERAKDLKQINQNILDFVKHSHISTEDEQKWVEFLKRANTHNLSKLNSSMPAT